MMSRELLMLLRLATEEMSTDEWTFYHQDTEDGSGGLWQSQGGCPPLILSVRKMGAEQLQPNAGILSV